jgi:hypothetical protein
MQLGSLARRHISSSERVVINPSVAASQCRVLQLASSSSVVPPPGLALSVAHLRALGLAPQPSLLLDSRFAAVSSGVLEGISNDAASSSQCSGARADAPALHHSSGAKRKCSDVSFNPLEMRAELDNDVRAQSAKGSQDTMLNTWNKIISLGMVTRAALFLLHQTLC